MSLNIYYWNCAAGLLKKIDYIKELITGNNVDIFFVAEAELKIDSDLSVLNMSGYDLIVSQTFISRKKARLICYKKKDIKELSGFDEKIRS